MQIVKMEEIKIFNWKDAVRLLKIIWKIEIDIIPKVISPVIVLKSLFKLNNKIIPDSKII